eukprot:COSAG01_NODE_405_length_17466_cov_554.403697_21_plen_61_part_00
MSRPFSSWNRPVLTEICLCHACSCQEILRVEMAGQGKQQQEQEAEPERQGRRQQQSTREG